MMYVRRDKNIPGDNVHILERLECITHFTLLKLLMTGKQAVGEKVIVQQYSILI